MLRGKQLQLRLHQRQRRAQLVGSVAGELPLGGKGIVQPLQHLVERAAQLLNSGNTSSSILISAKIVQLHLLHLRGKAAQGLERASADKIGEDAAEQRTAAVIYQLVVRKRPCAPSTTMVNSSSAL